MITEALINAIGGLANSAGSLWSNIQGRKSMRHAQNRQFNFAREQTQKMIDLANTAHQREVADLRAAGLNPILSAGGNGAGTPSLPTLSAEGFTPSNPMSGLASSARDIARYVSDEYRAGVDNTKANTDLQNEQADLTSEQKQLTAANKEQALNSYLAHRDATMLEGQNDYVEQQLRRAAQLYEYGVRPEYDKYGRAVGLHFVNKSNWLKSMELAREGLRSDLKNSANANWRANVSTFVPLISGALNSAATISTKGGKRRP